jgi:hypothetical protein
LAQAGRTPCPRRPTTPDTENVTDKSSATLISARMIAAGDSGSPATAQGSSAAQPLPAGFFARPKGRRHGQVGLLRCIVCGRCSRFVDPFPHPRR